MIGQQMAVAPYTKGDLVDFLDLFPAFRDIALVYS